MATGNDLVELWGEKVYRATTEFFAERPDGMTDEKLRGIFDNMAPGFGDHVLSDLYKPLLEWDELTEQERLGWIMAVIFRLLPFSTEVAQTIRDARPVREANMRAARN